MSKKCTIQDLKKAYSVAIQKISKDASKIVPGIIELCFEEANMGRKYLWLEDLEKVSLGNCSSELLKEIKSQLMDEGFTVQFASEFFEDSYDKGIVISGWSN